MPFSGLTPNHQVEPLASGKFQVKHDKDKYFKWAFQGAMKQIKYGKVFAKKKSPFCFPQYQECTVLFSRLLLGLGARYRAGVS